MNGLNKIYEMESEKPLDEKIYQDIAKKCGFDKLSFREYDSDNIENGELAWFFNDGMFTILETDAYRYGINGMIQAECHTHFYYNDKMEILYGMDDSRFILPSLAKKRLSQIKKFLNSLCKKGDQIWEKKYGRH